MIHCCFSVVKRGINFVINCATCVLYLTHIVYWITSQSTSALQAYHHNRAKFQGTNLMELTHYIAEKLDELPGAQIDAIYTDFQKAFDGVNHPMLIQKLQTFGFSESLIGLLRLYLRDRKQYVVFKGSRSFAYNCPFGVPQRSNLSPFLFLLFVDDLSLKFSLLADHLKLFRMISTDNDRSLLQKDLNALGDRPIPQ